ncbi:hypothetical protein OG373_01785 [Streptomyces avidinii]|uniref:hypothetical protein n=1 Tax=Streptomyces avidinii TaxID=1895 RepID=UPI0038695262|nr:hypothetical protein OG373_01785 [Streptomyces avidinii]
MTDHVAPTSRLLVLHDYGMGGSWWWVHARSVREVRETFADVEVVDSPETVERAEGWGLDEAWVDGATTPDGLDGLRAKREAQRGLAGFGALADRKTVWLRRRWDYEDDEDMTLYLMEVEADGRRTRQVALVPGGTGVRSGPDDWPFNPPVVDLYDPELVGMEISEDEFETHWRSARHVDEA